MVLKQLAGELFNEISNELREMLREEITTLLSGHLKTQQRTHIQTHEACDILDCSPNKLREVCVEYNIKAKKIIGTNYYRRTDIDRLFNDWPE